MKPRLVFIPVCKHVCFCRKIWEPLGINLFWELASTEHSRKCSFWNFCISLMPLYVGSKYSKKIQNVAFIWNYIFGLHSEKKILLIILSKTSKFYFDAEVQTCCSLNGKAVKALVLVGSFQTAWRSATVLQSSLLQSNMLLSRISEIN